MAIREYVQFGRNIEVQIKNFTTNEIVFIGNEFRIDFNFYKTIDQVNEASVGEIKIYNLTQETFDRIAQINNEVMLSCGYVYAGTFPLFIANVVEVNQEFTDNSTVCTLKVSANFAEMYFTKHTFAENNIPLGALLEKISQKLGIDNGKFIVDSFNIPQEYHSLIKKYFIERKVTFYATGSAKDILAQVCDTYQLFSDYDANWDKGSAIRFFIRSHAIAHYINQASQPYEKSTRVSNTFLNLFEEDIGSVQGNYVTTLSKDTGLLGYPSADIKIEKVPENWKLKGNEEITLKGQQTILDTRQKEQESNRRAAEASAKRAERERKAIEKGKPLKPLNPKKEVSKKPAMVQISRKFIKAKALLNPLVKPQSHIEIKSEFYNYNGIYRVRNAKYTGSNRDGEFTMELYLEDSDRRNATIATADEVARYGDKTDATSEDVSVDGDIGSQNTPTQDMGGESE